MNNLEFVHQHQKSLLHNLKQNNTFQEIDDYCGLLSCRGDRSDFVYAFGDFGGRIWDFISCVSHDHPDFTSFYREHKTHLDDLADLLEIANYSRINGLDVYEKGRKAFLSKLPNSLLKIDSPNKNAKNARLLERKWERCLVRKKKKPQSVDMKGFYRRSASMWENLPSDFSSYFRFDQSYLDEIEKAKHIADRYEKLGCIQLSEEVNHSIKAFNERSQDMVCGFHRITMTSAAAILAKMHGFGLVLPLHEHDRIIMAPKKFCGSWDFNPDSFIESFGYPFAVRAYPMHEMKKPKDFPGVFSSLETCGDLNGLSLIHI